MVAQSSFRRDSVSGFRCTTIGISVGMPAETVKAIVCLTAGPARDSLYYYRARYYDPSAGRFLSEDPVGFDGGGNFYRYVYNDPIGLADPNGLSPADVQRILKACQKCTDQLTAQGERRAGKGWPNGIFNNLISTLTWGRMYSGCDRQANLTSGCLNSPSPPYDDHWDCSPMSVHWGLHRVTRCHSSNRSDPDVICDSWENSSETIPRSPDKHD